MAPQKNKKISKIFTRYSDNFLFPSPIKEPNTHPSTWRLWQFRILEEKLTSLKRALGKFKIHTTKITSKFTRENNFGTMDSLADH